jgi:hypothetical protein
MPLKSVTHDEIARRAYEIFETRGRQHGRDLDDWLRAERELYRQAPQKELNSAMAHPHLAFCPYLSVQKVIEFADWQLGPVESFEDQWADVKFKSQSKAFLAKFVDNSGKPIEHPSLLRRRGGPIDGRLPAPEEIEALEAAIAFAFLDENPRRTPKTVGHGWNVLTADNAEPFFWPIDVEAGYVTVSTGLMVRTLGGGYQIADAELVIRPPLDLHLPLGSHTADAMCLEAVYRTVLSSLQRPGANPTADRIKTAIGWLGKAWRNTATVHFPERVVFLKTAFEAMTGTSKSHVSAQKLRQLFEAVPNTSPTDSELLLWSPAERPVYTWTFMKNGKPQTVQVTGLEHWFMSFADARNTIIHQGVVPSLAYTNPSNAEYEGPFVFTAEFLLRAVIKVSLAQFGYPDLWRSATWRAVKAAYDELEARERASASASANPPVT